MQIAAPRVFHHNRRALASCVFRTKRRAIEQGLAPRVFRLNDHTDWKVRTPSVFHLSCRNLIPRIFHLIHRFIVQDLAGACFFRKLRSGLLGLPYVDCSILYSSCWFQFKSDNSNLAMEGPRSKRLIATAAMREGLCSRPCPSRRFLSLQECSPYAGVDFQGSSVGNDQCRPSRFQQLLEPEVAKNAGDCLAGGADVLADLSVCQRAE
jgi:hypothetical protein